jgi:hypothetical protein
MNITRSTPSFDAWAETLSDKCGIVFARKEVQHRTQRFDEPCLVFLLDSSSYPTFTKWLDGQVSHLCAVDYGQEEDTSQFYAVVSEWAVAEVIGAHFPYEEALRDWKTAVFGLTPLRHYGFNISFYEDKVIFTTQYSAVTDLIRKIFAEAGLPYQCTSDTFSSAVSVKASYLKARDLMPPKPLDK